MVKVLVSFVILAVALRSSTATNLTEVCEYEDFYKYPCVNKYIRFNLDDDPVDFGITAGQYASNKVAYVGLVSFLDIVLIFGRLQLDPRGIVSNNPGKFFANDTDRMWYMYNDLNHYYKWVDSQNGDIPPFAVAAGAEAIGFSLMPARITNKNGFVTIGTASSLHGTMFYPDAIGRTRTAGSGYQVLTCKSRLQNEQPFPVPKLPNSGPNIDTGCINNWAPYLGDDGPSRNGVKAGEHGCNSPAYVGKGKPDESVLPGRIQTNHPAGFYTIYHDQLNYMPNGSYYLVDNPHYTYKWITYDPLNFPKNRVYARDDDTPIATSIYRTTVNGKTEVGLFVFRLALVPNENSTGDYFSDYEILVCDPVPKYRCAQNWTTLNISNPSQSPSVNGFNLGTLNNSIDVYIGRSCDSNLGRAQVSPSSSAGVYYLDDFNATEEFDNSPLTTEYLVKNPNYSYNWIPSSRGEKVRNALGQHREGHQSYYIGMTSINDNVFVGKVKPGEGLFFVDADGKQKSTTSYKVLTCTSPEPKNGIDDDDQCDQSWFTQYWCPANKWWSYDEEKCICKREFVDENDEREWNEDTCTYK